MDGMGSAAQDVLIVDVEVTGPRLEPRASVMVRDGCFDFLNLPIFLKKGFISLNSELWCSIRSDQVSNDTVVYISTSPT